MVMRNRRYQQSQKGYSRLSSKEAERRIVDEELYGPDVSDRIASADDRGVAALLFGRGVERNGVADPLRRGVGAGLRGVEGVDSVRPDRVTPPAVREARSAPAARTGSVGTTRARADRASRQAAGERGGVLVRIWQAIRRLFA